MIPRRCRRFRICARGGENPLEGGSATLPINLVSPPSSAFPMEDPKPGVLPNWTGNAEVATGSEHVSASHPLMQSPTVLHESPEYVVLEESPPPPPQPNPVGPIFPPLSPCQDAYIEQENAILYLIWPSRGGSSGRRHSSSGGAPSPVAARPTPQFCQFWGVLWSLAPWPGGLLAGAVAGHLLLAGVEVPRFDILGTPLKHGERLT